MRCTSPYMLKRSIRPLSPRPTVIVFAIALPTPGLRTEVVARGVPVGVAVMNVSAVRPAAVSVRITPVALTGTPPTPATWTVIDDSGPTGAAAGTPIGSRVSRMRAGSTVTIVDGTDAGAVEAL